MSSAGPDRNTSRARQRKLRIAIGLAIIGGLILTHYFHGDTTADQFGHNFLWHTGLKLIVIPILLAVWVALKGFWQGQSRPLVEKNKSDNPLSIKIK